jgi:hypothetical protein
MLDFHAKTPALAGKP